MESSLSAGSVRLAPRMRPSIRNVWVNALAATIRGNLPIANGAAFHARLLKRWTVRPIISSLIVAGELTCLAIRYGNLGRYETNTAMSILRINGDEER